MGKKTFLKAVSIFACLSILMLSVPGAIASPRTDKKTYTYTYRLMMKTATMLSSFLAFLNLNTNNEEGNTASNNDSNRKIRILGTLSSVRRPNSGDGEDDEEKSAKRH